MNDENFSEAENRRPAGFFCVKTRPAFSACSFLFALSSFLRFSDVFDRTFLQRLQFYVKRDGPGRVHPVKQDDAGFPRFVHRRDGSVSEDIVAYSLPCRVSRHPVFGIIDQTAAAEEDIISRLIDQTFPRLFHKGQQIFPMSRRKREG